MGVAQSIVLGIGLVGFIIGFVLQFRLRRTFQRRR
jgi:hypothetical protein